MLLRKISGTSGERATILPPNRSRHHPCLGRSPLRPRRGRPGFRVPPSGSGTGPGTEPGLRRRGRTEGEVHSNTRETAVTPAVRSGYGFQEPEPGTCRLDQPRIPQEGAAPRWAAPPLTAAAGRRARLRPQHLQPPSEQRQSARALCAWRRGTRGSRPRKDAEVVTPNTALLSHLSSTGNAAKQQTTPHQTRTSARELLRAAPPDGDAEPARVGRGRPPPRAPPKGGHHLQKGLRQADDSSPGPHSQHKPTQERA